MKEIKEEKEDNSISVEARRFLRLFDENKRMYGTNAIDITLETLRKENKNDKDN